MAIKGFYIPGGYYDKEGMEGPIKCITCKETTVLLPRKTCRECEEIDRLIEELFIGIEYEVDEKGISPIRAEEEVITEAMQN